MERCVVPDFYTILCEGSFLKLVLIIRKPSCFPAVEMFDELDSHTQTLITNAYVKHKLSTFRVKNFLEI